MLIPTVLLDLINKYNEIGIVFLNNDHVFWFNGKRFEYWCEAPENVEDVMLYRNTLYCKKLNSFLLFVLKNKNGLQVDYHYNHYHPLRIFSRYGKKAVCLQKVIYVLHRELPIGVDFDQFNAYESRHTNYDHIDCNCDPITKVESFDCDENDIPIIGGEHLRINFNIPIKPEDCGIQKYDNHIYFFNSVGSWKLNFSKEVMTLLPLSLIDDDHVLAMVSLNNLFYILYFKYDYRIFAKIFDFKQDEWISDTEIINKSKKRKIEESVWG